MKININLPKLIFYFSFLLSIWFLVFMAIPPYNWRAEIGYFVLFLLMEELTRYRYYDYKPEKNPRFNQVISAAFNMILETDRIVVHKNGKDIKRYKVHIEEIKESDDASTEDSNPDES